MQRVSWKIRLHFIGTWISQKKKNASQQKINIALRHYFLLISSRLVFIWLIVIVINVCSLSAASPRPGEARLAAACGFSGKWLCLIAGLIRNLFCLSPLAEEKATCLLGLVLVSQQSAWHQREF